MARKDLNIDINELTPQQLKQILPTLAKRANSRLYRIDKNNIGYTAYNIAQQYLNTTGRKYFSGTPGDMADMKVEARAIQRFLNSQTSTLTGITGINAQRLETFREKGIDIKPSQETSFIDFISSELFKALAMMVDSDTIISDYNLALQQGFTPDQIVADYYNFLNTKTMTFEQINEERLKGVDLR